MRYCTAGLAEVDAPLSGPESGADSGVARVNTPAAPLSVPFAGHRCRAALV